MKYVLKVCGTTVVLALFIYLMLVMSLSAFTNYQVPEMIGLLFIIYLLPYTILFNIITALILYMVIFNIYSFTNKQLIKSILSVLSVIIIFAGFKTLFVVDPAEVYDDNYFLAIIISITLITFIWYYEFNPEVIAVKAPVFPFDI